jgi:hypothetical protein
MNRAENEIVKIKQKSLEHEVLKFSRQGSTYFDAVVYEPYSPVWGHHYLGKCAASIFPVPWTWRQYSTEQIRLLYNL